MTDQEFFHWLNGYIEVSACTSIGEVQTAIIKDKLQSVFVKETRTFAGGSLSGQSIGGGTMDGSQWSSTVIGSTVASNQIVTT